MTLSPRAQGCPALPPRPPPPAALLTLALLAALAACGRHTTDTDPDIAPPTDPSALVLRVLEKPGFAGPISGSPTPEFSLYGDGRVIVAAGRRGALAMADEYRLTTPAYHRLYRSALASGLGHDRTIDTPPSLDASVLTIQLLVGGRVHATRIVAPGAGDSDRRVVAAFRATLRPASLRPADLAGGPTPYRPTRLATVATWYAARTDPAAPRWPFGNLAQGTQITAGLCTIHSGAELATADRLATAQAASTRWSSAGNLYYVVFRPLLPDESDCTALG